MVQCLYVVSFMGFALVVTFGIWDWSLPAVLLAFSAACISSVVRSDRTRDWVVRVGLIGLALSAAIATQQRSGTWFRGSAGVPFDEPILQAISNGLVTWGPMVNPISHEKDGLNSLFYHHLLYLDIGLLDRLGRLEVYVGLLVVGPIICAFVISSTLLLLVRAWSGATDWNSHLRLAPLVATVAFIVGLVGPGFTSPSVHFGVGGLLVAVYVVTASMREETTASQVAAAGIATAMLAFSKFPYFYAVPIVILTLGFRDLRRFWKAMFASVATASLLLYGASISRGDEAGSVSIEFWSNPHLNPFAPNLHTLLDFLNVVVSPISLSATALLLALVVLDSSDRQLVVGFIFVLFISVIASTSVIAAGGGGDYFAHPGQLVALLMFPKLFARNAVPRHQMTSTFVSSVVLVASVHLVSRYFEIQVLSARNLGSSLAAVAIAAVLVRSRLHTTRQRLPSSPRILSLVLTSLLLLSLIDSTRQIYPDFPPHLRWQPPTSDSDWLGSSDFREIAKFVNARTDPDALLAFSICRICSDGSDNRGGDIWVAAIIERRFLTLGKLFKGEELSMRALSDLELSQSIGVGEPADVIKGLRHRKVVYLLADRSRVNREWLQELEVYGARLWFSNGSYDLLQL